MACQTPLPSDSSSVSGRLTGFVLCAGVGWRVAECPTPWPLKDKSQSVRVRCNTAPRSLPINKIGIYSGGIRTSRLEVLPKGALTVIPMQSGTSKGSTQGASQDSSCGAFQGSTSKGALKVLPKIAIGNFSGGRRTGGEHSRCCPGNVRECNQWFSKVRL